MPQDTTICQDDQPDKALVDQLFCHFFDKAKENLIKNGHVAPFVFLLCGMLQKPKIIALPAELDSEEHKDVFAGFVKDELKKHKAWGYAMVVESWVLWSEDFPNGTVPRGRAPSEHPQRREAIYTVLVTRNESRCAMAFFERQDGRAVITREAEMPSDVAMDGRFANFFN
jgi:hypothetical protein